MSSLISKFCPAALLLTMVIVYGSAAPVAGQDQPDTVLENRGDAADLWQNISAESSDGGLCVGGLVFRKHVNCPIGDAVLTAVGSTLVVSNLAPSGSAAATQLCDAPGDGDEIEPDDSEKAGNDGYRVDLDDIEIPTDVTAFYVQLEEYWGTTKTEPDWETDPIPIGFRSSESDGNTTITGCADFDECPIFCSRVIVEFQGGGAPGEIECDAGDLFSATGPGLVVTLRKVITKGTCHGKSETCSECDARRKTELQYVLADIVDGWTRNTVGDACDVISGGPTFSANKIFIRPKLSSCRETTESPPDCTTAGASACCTDSGRATGAAASLGGNTPPLRKILLLAEKDAVRSGRTIAGPVTGSFVILGESICIDPECLTTIPTVSAWGVGILALVLCGAAAILLRRRSSYTTTPES